MQMSPAERRFSGLSRTLNYDVIRLTLSKADVWTVIDDVARLIEIKKEFLFIQYLLLPSVAYVSEGRQKL